MEEQQNELQQEEQTKKSKLDIVITILAILLGLSIVALAGVLAYKYFAGDVQPTVTIPDNIITSQDAGVNENADATEGQEGNEQTESGEENEDTSAGQTMTGSTSVLGSTGNGAGEEATLLYFHKRNDQENQPFEADNMFPGDAVARNFCVRVDYKDTATVKFRAEIQKREGYEKFAQVLKLRVIDINADKIMYDGFLKDWTGTIEHTFTANGSATGEVYYQIVGYLDTSVGNHYQNCGLYADFHWWVEDVQNLESPKTGDNSNIELFLGLFGMSLFVLILLLSRRRKEEYDGQ